MSRFALHYKLPENMIDDFASTDKPFLAAIPELKKIGRGTAFRASPDNVDPHLIPLPYLFLS